MKISSIHLKDFHQFKDITIDLTYPKGHEKEGQPLDKVCFIGQSGTGKTTLLELIPAFLIDYKTALITKIGVQNLIDKGGIRLIFGNSNEYSIEIKFTKSKIMDTDRTHNFRLFLSSQEHKPVSRQWENSILNGGTIDPQQSFDYLQNQWKKIATKPIYFPANLNYNIEENLENNLEENEIIDFSKDNISIVWNLILDSIQKYQEQELKIRQDISKTVEQSSSDLNTIKEALKKLEDWKSKEFNPIQDVADNCLNKLLSHFKLRIKTELDIKTKDDIGFIKIEDLSKNEIPTSLWSTGTKQVVLSALPLYLLKSKHTIILFDEPERSLYPDLQRIIIDFYSSLTESCQFFYSTHSPIIASSFEPWEIVELKFNEEGYVYRELYYEGENHVDNYKWNPKLMRWDDILQRVFDLPNDGSTERKKKLDELATFNVKYKKLDKQGKGQSEEAKEILSQIETLSSELSNWN